MKKYILPFFLSLSGLVFSQEKIEDANYSRIAEMAAESVNKGDFEQTLALLDKINKNDSTYCSVLVSKSYYLLQLKKYDEAIQVTTEGLNRDCWSSNSSFYINQGNAYLQKEEPAKALEVYHTALESYPKNASLWYNMGIVLEKLEQEGEAMDAYKKAIFYNPLYASAHLKLGDICYRQNRMAQAMMCYNMFLLLQPDGDNSFEMLKNLNNLAGQKNDNSTNPDLENFFGAEKFSTTDLILNNKIALNDNYEIDNKIDLPLTRQNHVLLEQLKTYKGKEGFWTSLYVPMFQWIASHNYFDQFTYTIFYSVENEGFKKEVNKNLDEVKAFVSAFIKQWLQQLSETSAVLEPSLGVRKYQYENGKLVGVGEIRDNVPVGEWQFFTEEGRPGAFGKFDENGKRVGAWERKNRKDQLAEVANYVDGLQNGKNNLFYFNGKPQVVSNYKNDELDGEFLYYRKTGALEQRKYFKKGKLDSIYRSYFPVGEAIQEFYVPYKDGHIEGEAIEYFATGKPFSRMPFSGGKLNGVQRKYFLNDSLSSEITYENGLMAGPYKTYFANGQVAEVGQASGNDFTGDWKTYYPNGNINSEYHFEDGNIDGLYRYYDQDGKLYYEYDYRKGEIITYRFFDKQGELLKEERKKGGEFYYTEYTPNGILKSEGLYDISGGKSGEWKYYTNDGVLNSRSSFEENLAQGEQISYFSNGDIKEVTHFKNDSLDGYYQKFYKTGKMKLQGWYKNNEASGEWRWYYADGTLESVNFFHHDELDGEQKYYGVDGSLSSIVEYDHGQPLKYTYFDPEGTELETLNYVGDQPEIHVVKHHLNGTAAEESTYLYGIQHGPHKEYDSHGNLITSGNYLNGKRDGTWEMYYENGKTKKEIGYLNGVANGLLKRYFENGKIDGDYFYRLGKATGEWKGYHENGQLSSLTPYYEDEPHGRKEFYSREGELALVRFYEYGRLVGYSYLDENSKELPMIPLEKETGKIKSYYDNGKVSREIEFRYGNFVNTFKSYYYSGQPETEIQYMDDDYHGLYKAYYPNGNIKKEYTYNLDELHGPSKDYFENGQLKKYTEYKNDVKNGESRTYDESGKLLKSEKYINGELISPQQS